MRLALLAAVSAAVMTVACVAAEHSEVNAARNAHERCVARLGESDPECQGLHERLLSAEKRYENNAGRAWGCDPVREQCPQAP